MSEPVAAAAFGAIIEVGLALVLVERPNMLVDFAKGFVVFVEFERAKELVPFEEAAAGSRNLEVAEGCVVVAILGVALVFTLPDRANAIDFFAAGSFFSAGVFNADSDGALTVRGSLVLGFDAVDLMGRGSIGKSSPGIILSTSSSVSSSASSASIGCSELVCDKEGEWDRVVVEGCRVGISVDAEAEAEALLDAAGDPTTGLTSSTTSGS